MELLSRFLDLSSTPRRPPGGASPVRESKDDLTPLVGAEEEVCFGAIALKKYGVAGGSFG